ncbi:hypothetical protein [Caldanaerobacter subterraneus]|uniref:Uncharacterized protein n=1 Tax=Caldanaerobacter subterraneus TaxID=911092 RepID=A0A7Y2L5Y7_9THEO|nr:hypothetical protein [Caldanaerobacter subterraneus]NNG66419.1 hypothetical protein [Caldanaerobacter subterraneus]
MKFEKDKFINSISKIPQIPDEILKKMNKMQLILEMLDWGNSSYIDFDAFTLDNLYEVWDYLNDLAFSRVNTSDKYDPARNAAKAYQTVVSLINLKSRKFLFDEDFF